MDWAISLLVKIDDPLALAINNFLACFAFPNAACEYFIKDLDATGVLGNTLSDLVATSSKGIKIEKNDLVALLAEDGQIIELKLRIGQNANTDYVVIVRDGHILDILGKGRKPTIEEVGPYEDLDKNEFLPF